MSEITMADLDQSEAAMEEARAAFLADKNDDTREALTAAAQGHQELRGAWRQQEVEAGRRQPAVHIGGDAAPEED